MPGENGRCPERTEVALRERKLPGENGSCPERPEVSRRERKLPGETGGFPDRMEVARRDQKLPKLEGSIRPEVADWNGPGQIGSGIQGEADRERQTRSGSKQEVVQKRSGPKLKIV